MNGNCLICFGEVTEDEIEITEEIFPCPCKFAIHTECLFRWISIHRRCPICATPLVRFYDNYYDEESSGRSSPLPEDIRVIQIIDNRNTLRCYIQTLLFFSFSGFSIFIFTRFT